MSNEALTLAQHETSSQKATAELWLQNLRDLVIDSDKKQDEAAVVLKRIKAECRKLEGRRTEITQPLNTALRSVNDLFRPPRELFEELEKLLKEKIADYVRWKKEANAEALQQVVAAPTAAQASQLLARVGVVSPPAGIGVRPVWKFEICDPDAIPRELCSPDTAKIQAALSRGEQVPGVRVFQDSIVTVRQ